MEKKERRGRPVGSTTVNIDLKTRPRKYTEIHTDKKTGIKSIWKYNLDITDKGPISTEFEYPKGYLSEGENEENLPKSQRKYFNPSNGKMVGYTRAYQLGLIKN